MCTPLLRCTTSVIPSAVTTVVRRREISSGWDFLRSGLLGASCGSTLAAVLLKTPHPAHTLIGARLETFLSDRKYRQPGYQDSGDDKRDKSQRPIAQRPNRDNTYGPRPLNMPGTRTLSRCAQCGKVINLAGEMPAACSCGFALHSCKQCAHFDPASRFECRQTILERIPKKDLSNTCPVFLLKTSVERETTSSGNRADDARKAFENLFKK